jgi:dTDP-4-amino-4,6-dideoxygalactose transaminase
LSDPAHYVTSEYYQPGLIDQVGMAAAAMTLIVAIFAVGVVIAPRMLRRRKRMNPILRKILTVFAAIGKPASAISFGRRRQHKLGTRRKTESHYKMQLGSTAERKEAPEPRTPAPQPVNPGPAGQAFAKKRFTTDLSLLPEEAWPFYGEDEVAAVADILRSGKVNQWTGTHVFKFEQAYTRELRNGRAIALANGSLALELALRAFRIGPGDEVIVTPRSFVASAFCVRLVGATPVFADVDRDSGNITAETIAGAITSRTKAVIPVHLGGWPADMPAIAALCRAKGLYLIEDCAQAHGAEIEGLPVGSFGDAAAFSFCQDKIISTAGEGGLVTFRDDDAFEWAWSFKDHGKNRQRALERPTQPGFRWLHDDVGTNWRMTEIAAAIGLLQMDKLPRWRDARTRNAEIWAEALERVPGLRVPRPPRNITGAYYKFYAYVDIDPARNGALRDRILEAADRVGVRVFSGSCSEMYREAAFRDLAVERLPVARELGDASLMFEVHPTLDPRRLRDRADAVANMIQDTLRDLKGRTIATGDTVHASSGETVPLPRDRLAQGS